MSDMSFAQKSWRLSPMYFFYFSIFGIFIPYIARYLTDAGLTNREASIVVAVFFGVNMFAPFLFSFLADRSGRRMIFIRTGYFLMGAFYLLAYFGSGFWFYLICFGLFGTFLSAVLPQMESVTLGVLGDQRSRYGQVRLWGSVGFVIIVWLIGSLIDSFSVRILPLLGVSVIGLMFFSTFFIPEQVRRTTTLERQSSRATSQSVNINWQQVIILLIVILLWQFGMAPYNTFFDLYLRGHGYSATIIGFLISFGTMTEILIFFYASRLLKRYSHKVLMTLALFLTSCRWLMLYFWPEYLITLVISQAAHAATFGLVHAVAVNRISMLFPEDQASFGQSLYLAVGTGAGLFVGNVIAGYFWTGSGLVYLLATAFVGLAMAVAWFGFKDLNFQIQTTPMK